MTTETTSTARYVAHFSPEAWVRDTAIEVDAQGAQEWDCTEFAGQNAGYLDRMAEQSPDSIDGEDGVTDNDDVFMGDPAAPEWVRNWQGPFTIRIRREAEPYVTEETVIVDAHLTEPQFRRVGELLNTPLGRHKPDSYRYVFEAESSGVANALCEYLRLAGVPYERKTTTRWEP